MKHFILISFIIFSSNTNAFAVAQKMVINSETNEVKILDLNPAEIAQNKRDKAAHLKDQVERKKRKADKEIFLDSLTEAQLKGFKALLEDGNIQ